MIGLGRSWTSIDAPRINSRATTSRVVLPGIRRPITSGTSDALKCLWCAVLSSRCVGVLPNDCRPHVDQKVFNTSAAPGSAKDAAEQFLWDKSHLRTQRHCDVLFSLRCKCIYAPKDNFWSYFDHPPASATPGPLLYLVRILCQYSTAFRCTCSAWLRQWLALGSY